MKTQPAVGTPGGQTYNVARAIETFLAQMAEGGASRLPAAVMKELLQNADDAGASEVTVTLDERTPPTGLRGSGYDPLLAPALLVRNDAKFRLKGEVAGKDVDDFTALCDVASGHKRLQAAAAGRFGIGFNSVYFLTDTPIVFSRRQVHVFDLRHHVFEENGWVFTIDDFFDRSATGTGPLKSLIEWALPKAASGASKSFGCRSQFTAQLRIVTPPPLRRECQCELAARPA